MEKTIKPTQTKGFFNKLKQRKADFDAKIIQTETQITETEEPIKADNKMGEDEKTQISPTMTHGDLAILENVMPVLNEIRDLLKGQNEKRNN